MDTESPRSRPWSGCCSLRGVRSLVPVGAKREVKDLCELALPVIISQFMIFGVSLISTVFCGHLGKAELAGVSLAISVINVIGISIGAGLSSACDTLVSQTFGSHNFREVGVIMQRAILILLLACFPCWALLVNTEPILLAVGQEPEVARLAQTYVNIFMPALPATFMYSLETRYLQNQGIIWPQVITGFVVNLLNALFNYIILFVFNMGVEGSAIANTLSQYSMVISLFIYIVWKGLYKATWRGWSKECLKDWGTFIRLAIPSMVMMCVEWWTYEMGGLLAGLISEAELGAQAVVYEIANIGYMFPLGFSVAGSVRVGNALGAGNTEQAKLSAQMALCCAATVSVCLATLIGSLKGHISYIFINDEQIRARVADVISFYAPFMLVEAVAAASGGVIRGAGKQKFGAICNILGYYGIGFPIGVSLMFAAKLGIKGLWTGLLLCVFLQCLALNIYLIRMNWRKTTIEAQIRAGVHTGSTDANSSESSDEHTGCTIDPCEVEDVPVVKSLQDVLAFRMLVVRRGLVLAAMLLVLAVGIIINVLLTTLGT